MKGAAGAGGGGVHGSRGAGEEGGKENRGAETEEGTVLEGRVGCQEEHVAEGSQEMSCSEGRGGAGRGKQHHVVEVADQPAVETLVFN